VLFAIATAIATAIASKQYYLTTTTSSNPFFTANLILIWYNRQHCHTDNLRP
jgi:hypothetical protein